MKKSILLLCAIFATSGFTFIAYEITSNYDPLYVIISSVIHKNETYKVVYMKRNESGNKIKVKYFAAKDGNETVSKRFQKWRVDKNIICLSSGGYMDSSQTPDGICVDNGVIVNRTLQNFDGLVIVYPTGGVVATSIKNGVNIPQGKIYIRDPFDFTTFLNWCETEHATVFQTHLLAFNNQLEIYNSNQTQRERRFLAVGKENNQLVHAIIHSPSPTTLYEGSRRTLEFLNSYKNMDVIFMINLDPGAQDVFFLFDEYGKVDNTIRGTRPLADAANLLVYYYE